MHPDLLTEQFFETLINGDRNEARSIARTALEACEKPQEIITDLFWPTYEQVDRLHRHDQLSDIGFNMATRLLRVLVDQTAAQYEIPEPTQRRIFAACGPNDADELGAQMAVDLLEAGGYPVRFAGGGIAGDELMAQIHEQQPEILLLFASAPGDLPQIRAMIDSLREINAVPNLQIAVGGGVFNRAEGLAEEIGADLWANDPLELVERLTDEPLRRATPEQRTVGRKRTSTRQAA